MKIRNAINYVAQGAIDIDHGIHKNAMHAIYNAFPRTSNHVSVFIKRARVKPPFGDAKNYLVLHPSNDAILAIATTEEDANAIVRCLDSIAEFVS